MHPAARDESLTEALARLAEEGYTEEFRAGPQGLVAPRCGVAHAPDTLEVMEVLRFEGLADPGDESIVFALSCPRHGVRGTYAVAYGPSAEPLDAEVLLGLPASCNHRR